jgi:superoxide dismutase, Cu-Zn family
MKRLFSVLLCLTLLATACSRPMAVAPKEPSSTLGTHPMHESYPSWDFALINTRGNIIGYAETMQGKSGLVMRVEVTNLPTGWHGMHLHEGGTCEDPDAGFIASGAHASHIHGNISTGHGFLSHIDGHDGDMPNLWVGGDGSGKADVFLRGMTFADLKEGNGVALIIHAGEDDYVSQPTGEAGKRLACGVLP